jgi:hypothetical protein
MVEYGNPRVLSVNEPAVQEDLLAHTPLLSLDKVLKYSTGPLVLQHAAGRKPALPRPGIDFARWQREQFGGCHLIRP